MKLVYLYDSNGYYIEDYMAHPSPLEPDLHIEPTDSTDLPLPVLSTNQCARFVSGAWTVEPDFTGEYWYDQTTGNRVEIKDKGQPPATLAATPPPPTPEQLLTRYKESAKQALASSDVTFLRIQESMVEGTLSPTDTSVVEWIKYRKALRMEVSATSAGTLPVRPAYPL